MLTNYIDPSAMHISAATLALIDERLEQLWSVEKVTQTTSVPTIVSLLRQNAKIGLVRASSGVITTNQTRRSLHEYIVDWIKRRMIAGVSATLCPRCKETVDDDALGTTACKCGVALAHICPSCNGHGASCACHVTCSSLEDCGNKETCSCASGYVTTPIRGLYSTPPTPPTTAGGLVDFLRDPDFIDSMMKQMHNRPDSFANLFMQQPQYPLTVGFFPKFKLEDV